MSVLLETHWGDVVIDVDPANSPVASQNFLKLVKARQYTQSLVFRIDHRTTTTTADPHHEGKVVIACTGCPRGNGTGGASVDAYMLADKSLRETSTSSSNRKDEDEILEAFVEKSSVRFLKSTVAGRTVGADQLVRGDVIALCIDGIPDTIGSQFGIVVQSPNNQLLGNDDRDEHPAMAGAPYPYVVLGRVAEDDSGVMDRLASTYCDDDNASSSLGRPLIDIRVIRALVVDDPYEDPQGLSNLMRRRGVVTTVLDDDGNDNKNDNHGTEYIGEERIVSSPSPERPPTEVVSERVPVHEVEDELDEDKLREREELALKKEDKGRAIVLEMLGDLPNADIRAPENVLFICKLNPVTQDEDLELIFSRFDPAVKVDIIRDHETGASLQYAFAEFRTQQQAAEAYFKMNNALVDDRRIKVDFSQSVSTIWDKYRQRMRRGADPNSSGSGGGGGGPSRAMPRLGPSFLETDREKREKDERRRSETHRGDDARRRGDDRPTSHDREHPHHNEGRHDRSRAEPYRPGREFGDARRSAGSTGDRDEFGRVKGWDRSEGGDRSGRRYETSSRDLQERDYVDRDRPRSERDHQRRYESRKVGHDRHDRDYDDERSSRGPESRRYEAREDKRREDGNGNDRRRYNEGAPRDRDYSPPGNGRPDGREVSRKERSRDADDPGKSRREGRRRDSSASYSDTDSRGSRNDRKRKKEKRKHQKKRKRRRYSDDDDSGDHSDRRRDEKRRTKKSRQRDDSDRSSYDNDDRSSKRRSTHRDHDRERRRKRRSRSRSRS